MERVRQAIQRRTRHSHWKQATSWHVKFVTSTSNGVRPLNQRKQRKRYRTKTKPQRGPIKTNPAHLSAKVPRRDTLTEKCEHILRGERRHDGTGGNHDSVILPHAMKKKTHVEIFSMEHSVVVPQNLDGRRRRGHPRSPNIIRA